MAKISGINTNLRGQIGDYLFRKTKYGTIVSEAPSRKETPVRTESQMYIRTQWVNLGAVYRQFNKTLKKAYEGLGNTMSVYNAFVQANINVVKVFITKQVKANGGKPVPLVAKGWNCIAAAHAYAAEPQLFSEVRFFEPPPSWTELVMSPDPTRDSYAIAVWGALKDYDWPDLLRSN